MRLSIVDGYAVLVGKAPLAGLVDSSNLRFFLEAHGGDCCFADLLSGRNQLKAIAEREPSTLLNMCAALRIVYVCHGRDAITPENRKYSVSLQKEHQNARCTIKYRSEERNSEIKK